MFVNKDCILDYLEDVWYVPDFVANIFSIGACLDKGYATRRRLKRGKLISRKMGKAWLKVYV